MKVTPLMPWETVEFPWGSAVRKRKGEWTHIFLKPNGQEINLEDNGIKVMLHENGIEFINPPLHIKERKKNNGIRMD